MGIKKELFICFVFAGSYCFAQVDSTASTNYIQKYHDKIALKLLFINAPNNFFFTNENDDIKYNIIPNKKERIALNVQYRAIEFGVGISPNFLPGNDPDSNAEIYNLNFRGFYKGWVCNLSFYHQKGFDISYDGTRTEAPKFETNKIGGSIAYSFNENFSYRATIGQREWQRKNAGSFMPSVYWFYTNFVMESSGFDNNNGAFNIALAPSYFYNYVIGKNILLTAGTSAGFGLNYNNFGDETSIKPLYEFALNAGVSFNYNRFFYGVQGNVIFLKQKLNNYMRLSDNITYVNVHVGYRFPAPKALTKTADKINEKLNLPKED
ncbi:DUF4421 family protein [Galbibacter sp. PAP.153]|uniref:DUF4421 family protein n=1 Tax=Galbibacter sp. PAP.153 TaxID=3104623 RepID=UPI0030080401